MTLDLEPIEKRNQERWRDAGMDAIREDVEALLIEVKRLRTEAEELRTTRADIFRQLVFAKSILRQIVGWAQDWMYSSSRVDVAEHTRLARAAEALEQIEGWARYVLTPDEESGS